MEKFLSLNVNVVVHKIIENIRMIGKRFDEITYLTYVS